MHWVPGRKGGIETQAEAWGSFGRYPNGQLFEYLSGKSPEVGAADLERTTGGACNGRT